MVAGLEIRAFRSLPEDIFTLLAVSRGEGHNLVERLVDEWDDGSNRFDRPGEIALEARFGPRLVGVGGLNRDPYIDDSQVGRIRHLYVTPDVRGMGVGRALVIALVDHARESFERVRLRAGADDARGFYLRLGFEETPDEEDSTHQIRLRYM
jgi:GNAT superfamily N-acetyltransferase